MTSKILLFLCVLMLNVFMLSVMATEEVGKKKLTHLTFL